MGSEKDYLTAFIYARRELVEFLDVLKYSKEPNILAISSCVLISIKQAIDIFDSILILYFSKKDYITICALCRVFADNVAVINHIYNNESKEEVEFKHFLYFLDGINYRNKYFEPLKQKEENEFKHLINHIVSLDDQVLKLIEERLDKNPLNAKKGASIIREQNNWKYKDINSNNRNNKYSWFDLYKQIIFEQIDSKTSIDDTKIFFVKMCESLSNHVHGLSLSWVDKSKEQFKDYKNLFLILLMCLKCLHRFSKQHYQTELGLIKQNNPHVPLFPTQSRG